MGTRRELFGAVLSVLFVSTICQGRVLASESDESALNLDEVEVVREVYQANCASCHGFDGIPMIPGVPNFVKGERMEKNDEELLASIREGKDSGSGGVPMPPWQGILSETEMRSALNYVRVVGGDNLFLENCASCHYATVPAPEDTVPKTAEALNNHQGPFNLCEGTDTDNMMERQDIVSVIRFLQGMLGD